MTRLAMRNLFQSKARLVISIGGVALALMLMLSLDAILAGVEERVVAYINHTGADLFVSQSGVRNLHMASSWLPASVAEQVGDRPGVEESTPLLYHSNLISVGDERSAAYVIGLPADPAMGGPWSITAGRTVPGPGEAILDQGIASASGMGLGDEIQILGRSFEIAGLSEGTATQGGSVVFISQEDFSQLRPGPPVISFVLVRVRPGADAAIVAQDIEAEVEGVTVLSRPAFASEEQKVVRDMGNDIVAIMNIIGFMVGLMVMSLTVYTATLSRRAEYGMLKAIGARNGDLVQTVLTQSLVSVVIGLGIGLTFTLALAAVAPRLDVPLTLVVRVDSVMRVAAASLVIAAVSAVLPIRQIRRLDPVMVFRGR